MTQDQSPPPPGIWNDKTSWCFIHGVQEEIKEDAWEVCFECKHVYNTKQEFVDAYNELKPPEAKGINVGNAHTVGFCQHCLHDF